MNEYFKTVSIHGHYSRFNGARVFGHFENKFGV